MVKIETKCITENGCGSSIFYSEALKKERRPLGIAKHLAQYEKMKLFQFLKNFRIILNDVGFFQWRSSLNSSMVIYETIVLFIDE